MKICSKCGICKELTEFSKEQNAKYGHRCSCKTCESLRSKKYGEKHKDKIALRKKNRRNTEPHNKLTENLRRH